MTTSWLTSRLMVSGVQNVEIVGPIIDVEVPPFRSLAMGEVTIIDEGRDY